MAAKKKAASRRSPASPSGGGLGLRKVLFTAIILAAGTVTGYVWRSYYPLALPFESALVADKESGDVDADSLRDLARAASNRAERAERERDQLRQRLDDLAASQQQAEKELADLKIKDVLEDQFRQ